MKTSGWPPKYVIVRGNRGSEMRNFFMVKRVLKQKIHSHKTPKYCHVEGSYEADDIFALKMYDSFEQVKCKANKLKPKMLTMDIKTLEEEHADLLSDKAGESEFWECLKDQIEQVKGLSYVLKCDCGEEYKVEVNL
ncbi:hypothetical protein Pint_30570 [Pistacia integerrima]|uniref:Uncharacterized protein n=1 Tax=Pistacia integerrima TaxID=434235 RepID=A0ACC0X1Z5_9ROSI|nr:hypothetical protein Pint_30570 [Pistacia integerrima]